MALLKTLYTPDDTGCAATYWRICDLYGDWKEETMTVKLCGYLSQSARDNGKHQMMEKTYNLSGDLFKQYFSAEAMSPEGKNVVSKGYEFIKGHAPEFIDAEDVLE